MKNQYFLYKIIAIFTFIVTFQEKTMAADIVDYKIIKKINENIEIRQYKDIILATTTAKIGENNKLFRSLFKFISGDNAQDQEIKMTAPVFQEKSETELSMSFIMPKNFDLSNLPIPNDKNIKIRSIKNQKFIAIRFSGSSSDKNFKKYQAILVKKINELGLDADLEKPIKAYYNQPLTLPFLKRNEILYHLN